MRIPFACPSCNAAGSADAVHIGKQVRCKHCGARFAMPSPDEPEADTYALEEPDEEPARGRSMGPPEGGSSFVPSRVDDTAAGDRPRRKKRTASGLTPMRVRKSRSGLLWRTWLIRCSAALVVLLVLIALLVPQGTLIAGCVLMILGSILILAGYGAGAYGAFCEDSLYGFLYLVIPLYAAYYMVTRWEDLWVWLAGSTVGVGLILAGTEIVRWAGVGT
jgi:hypothetical protein